MNAPIILVLDPDPAHREFCRLALSAVGQTAETAEDPLQALAAVERGRVGLVVAELHLSGMSGLELLETIKTEHPATDVILMSNHASFEAATSALKRGASDYLRKPFAAEALRAAADWALAHRRLLREEDGRVGLRLLESSRALAGLDEPERVLELGIAALLRQSGARAGLALFTGQGLRFMGFLHRKHLSEEHARALRDALVANRLTTLQGLRDFQVWSRARLRRAVGDELFNELGEAVLLPVWNREELKAIFFLFRGMSGRFSLDELDGAQRLGRHIELAYGAACRTREAKQLAYVDPLTDLYNARYLELALDERIAEARRLGGPLSVLLLDLDRFKEVNDLHGHLTGGRVLVEVSRILQGNVRGEDILVRYGGDEFALILPGTDGSGALDVAERIRAAVKEHVFLGREGKAIRLTTCIGVAAFPDDGDSRATLIEQAVRALTHGKGAERDAVCVARTH